MDLLTIVTKTRDYSKRKNATRTQAALFIGSAVALFLTLLINIFFFIFYIAGLFLSPVQTISVTVKLFLPPYTAKEFNGLYPLVFVAALVCVAVLTFLSIVYRRYERIFLCSAIAVLLLFTLTLGKALQLGQVVNNFEYYKHGFLWIASWGNYDTGYEPTYINVDKETGEILDCTKQICD